MSSRRPPLSVAQGSVLGRVCATTHRAEERARQGDQESLREELAQLRVAAAAARREENEAREKVREAERESYAKDKMLQELLAAAKGGSGVPGEALDQLREDLQLMFHVKAKNYEARQQLDEKEHKLASIQQELRAAQAHGLEEEVASAKADAKLKAQEWRRVSAETLGEVALMQEEANSLIQRATETQSAITRRQRERSDLEDKRQHLERESRQMETQSEQLKIKRLEVEQQMEDCRSRISSLQQLEADRGDLQRSIDSMNAQLKEARRDIVTLEQKSAAASKARLVTVSAALLAPGFAPLRGPSEADGASGLLLWRLRQALAVGQVSGMALLLAEDKTGDGRLSPQEFTRALQQLGLHGCHPLAVEQLFQDLSDGLVVEGRVSALDLVLALPLQRRPSAPPEAEVRDALDALVWACRRRRRPERDIRNRFLACLGRPDADFALEASSLCGALGVEGRLAEALARGLETRREDFLVEMPSWISPSPAARVSIILRFLRDLAACRDVLAPRLDCQSLGLEAFVEASASALGPRWSRRELEEVALLSEAAPPASAAIVAVEGARLMRAAAPGGLEVEFPEAAKAASPEAREQLEKAAKAKPRRSGAVPQAPTAAVGEAASEEAHPASLPAEPPAAAPAPPPPPPPPPPDAAVRSASPKKRGAGEAEDDEDEYEEDEYEDDMEEDFSDEDEDEDEEEN